MSTKLLVVEDNTAPPLRITLQRDGTAIDLTNSTVDLYLKRKGGAITNGGHTACTITNAAAGIVTYAPQAADFADYGTYEGEAKITYGDGTVERIYEDFKVRVRRKIGE